MPETDSSPASPAAAKLPTSERLLLILRHLVALIYPLALLAAVTFLFVQFGPTGWLWLVVLAAVVLSLMAPKPPQP